MHMSFVPDTQNKEFQDALNLIQYTRQSVFLTGKAGTGKSTFLRYICEHTKKKHVVLAPTGIAAINAGEARCTVSSNCRFILCCPMTPISACNGDASTNSLNTPNLTASCLKNWNWLSSTRFPWYGQISSMPSTVFYGFTHATSGEAFRRKTNPAGGRCIPVGSP